MNRTSRTALVLLLVACTRERSTSAFAATRGSAPAMPDDPVALAVALGVPAESLRAAGEERYRHQSYDSAEAIWQVEITRAREAHDLRAEARAHMWLGLANWRLGRYPAARREGELSLTLKRQIGMPDELSRSYNALGLLAWNEGRHADALGSFDSAVATARRAGDAEGVARAAANIPLVHVELGSYDAAKRELATALAAARDIHDERLQGNTLVNEGMLDIRLGSPQHALSLLAEARAHYAATGYATGESNALGQLATAWAELGDLQRAIAAADSALAIARAQGVLQQVAGLLEVIADLHEQAGSERLALRRLVEADSLDAAIGLAEEHGTNLRRVSAILLQLGEPQPSIAKAEEALAVHRAAHERGEVVYDRIQIGRSCAALGDRRRARAELDSAYDEATRLANPAAILEARLASARLALDDQGAERALHLLDFEHSASAGGVDWRLADVRAEALLAVGRLEEARRAEEMAVARLNQERASLAVGPLRSEYLRNRVAAFSRLVAIHMMRRDTAAAFQVAASVPGRGLAERLGQSLESTTPVASVANVERQLLRVAALEKQIRELPSGSQSLEQHAALEKALEEAQSSYTDALAHEGGSGAVLLGLTAPNLEQIEGRLAQNEALVTFLSGPDRLDVFVVRAGRVRTYSSALGARVLAERVRTVRELIGIGRLTPDLVTALGALHDVLLGPALVSGALAGVTRLVVVPHGALGAVPFAALWNPRTERFLVQDHGIGYAPSAAALTIERAEHARASSSAIVFAPLSDSLPGTKREAYAVARSLRGATVRLGAASTKSAVRDALAGADVVHIASHGWLDAQNPLFSRITVGSGVSSADDGQLEVHEILDLHASSALVFLSGCETGLTTSGLPFADASGEGSLAQALLVAGARSVVATLWRVDDSAAARLASGFYDAYARGVSPVEALATAQRQAITGQNHSMTWAAYGVWSSSFAN